MLADQFLEIEGEMFNELKQKERIKNFGHITEGTAENLEEESRAKTDLNGEVKN